MSPVFVLALGCGAPEEPPVSPEEPVPDEVSPWTYEPAADEVPAVDAAALGRAIDLAIPGILAQDARPIVDGYVAMFTASATPDCPETTSDGAGSLYWATGCAAPDGTFFGGYLSHYALDGTFDPESGLYLTGTQLGGNIALDGPGGTLDLEGAATVIRGVSEDGQTRVFASNLSGGFYVDGSGWLGEARSVTNTLTAYTVASIGGAVVLVDGSVEVEADGEPYSVLFVATQLANRAIGSECELEPGGSLEVRDPYGRWLDVGFHGPILESTGGDPARCDGCGDLSLDGEPLGEVCADFGPWFQWELLP